MKVILLHDVKNVGRKGDLKEVADGFARNFLLARQLALIATPEKINQWQQQKNHKEKLRVKQHESIVVQQKALSEMAVEFVIKVGERGKGFKAIGPADISDFLKRRGYNISKDKIKFSAVKEPGNYEAILSLGEGVLARVKVIVSGQRN